MDSGDFSHWFGVLEEIVPQTPKIVSTQEYWHLMFFCRSFCVLRFVTLFSTQILITIGLLFMKIWMIHILNELNPKKFSETQCPKFDLRYSPEFWKMQPQNFKAVNPQKVYTMLMSYLVGTALELLKWRELILFCWDSVSLVSVHWIFCKWYDT